MNTKVGRHCRICKKPGGLAATLSLRALGYVVQRDSDILHMYAHANCLAKERRKRLREERTMNNANREYYQANPDQGGPNGGKP